MEVKMSIVVIGGAPGVGKSTVLKEALKSVDAKVALHNFGSVILEQSGTGDRDKLRKMPPAEQKKHQAAAAKWLANKGKSANIIVDTHYIVSTPGGLMPGMPRHVLDALKPSLLVFVQCAPEQLMGRRKGDATRKRDSESADALGNLMEMNRAYLAACSVVSGANLLIVENPDGGLEKAGKELAAVLKNYIK